MSTPTNEISCAHAVNYDGTVIVGTSYTADADQHNTNSAIQAFVYINGVMSELPPIDGVPACAFGVSSSGNVIVGGGENDNFTYGADTLAVAFTGEFVGTVLDGGKYDFAQSPI